MTMAEEQKKVRLAERVKKVTPSLTLAITAKAKKLKQEGVDVISFSAGEPDFDTPDFIKQAAIQSLNQGFTKYTPESGTIELRRAISEKLQRDNGLTYAPEQIIVSTGAKHSIYNVLQVLVESGDEVIISSPYWLSYPEMVVLAGGTPVFLKTDIDQEYKFRPTDLKKLISARTKALILNSPSNPTGAVYDKGFLKEIAEVCKGHDFFIISDEIYEKIIFDGREHCSIGAMDPEIFSRTITIGGASKAYAMTGWRLGFAACPLPIAKACSSLQSHSTSNPTSFAQSGYLEALKSGDSEAARMKSIFEKRRDFIYQQVRQVPKLKAFKPQGAFYLFVDISETKLNSLDFANRLLDEAKVAVVPGIAFGDDYAIRMSFACSEQSIEKGVKRLSDWIAKLQ